MVVDLDVGFHLDTEVDGFALGTGKLEGKVEHGILGLAAEQLEQVGANGNGNLSLGCVSIRIAARRTFTLRCQ